MNTREKNRPEDWKDKYFKALNEFDEHERRSNQQLARIKRDLVRVLDNFRSRDPEFARDLDRVSQPISSADETQQKCLTELCTRASELAAAVVPNMAAKGSISTAPAAYARLVEELSLTSTYAQHLPGLRAALNVEDSDNSVEAVTRLAAKLSEIIAGNGNEAPAQARDTIQTLIDHVSLPESAQAQIASLTTALSQANDAVALRKVAKDLANMLVDQVSTMQAELAELNFFLVCVKKRLDQVQVHIANDNTARAEAGLERDQFGSDVRASLHNMRDHVDGAQDIDNLKSAIQQQIAELDGRVVSFVSQQSERQLTGLDANADLARQLVAMEEEAKALRAKLAAAQSRAVRDVLTGLPNRAGYNERLNLEHTRMLRSGTPLTLAVVDLDKFKIINDTWGHQAGDRVLKHVARELVRQIRKQDFFCRFGGEEFVLLLPDTDLSDALNLVEGLRQHIHACRFTYKDSPVNVTISCGLAQFSRDDEPAAVFERADAGLYRAKNNGRNRCAAITRG